jgi:hypothetical protein
MLCKSELGLAPRDYNILTPIPFKIPEIYLNTGIYFELNDIF